MAREAIRLQFGKYNGDEHWGFDAVVLGRDAQGLWLGVTGGTRVARPGLEFAAHGDFVVLVPDDAWWVATFNTAPGGKDHDIDVYVDITTPTTVNQGEAFTLDLDLDVVKRTNGDLGLDDEDEFERHAREMSYPSRLVTAAREAADTVMAMVRDGAAPFDGSHETWLAKL